MHIVLKTLKCDETYEYKVNYQHNHRSQRCLKESINRHWKDDGGGGTINLCLEIFDFGFQQRRRDLKWFNPRIDISSTHGLNRAEWEIQEFQSEGNE